MPEGLVSVAVGGYDAVFLYKPGTMRVSKDANLRARCQFDLVYTPGGEFNPRRGNKVDAYFNNVQWFGGIATEMEKFAPRRPPGEDQKIILSVKAVDWTIFLERYFVKRYFSNRTAGQIVRTLIEEEIPDDIIGTDDVQDGITVSIADFTDFRSIGECLTDLATRCSTDSERWIWYIRPDRTLYFGPQTAIAAPFDITDASDDLIVRRTMRSRVSLDNYANNVILIGGLRPSEPITEEFEGDLITRSWDVTNDMFEAPQILIDDVAVTDIGEEGDETEHAWYWERGGRTIRQAETINDLPQTPIDYLQSIKVIYATSQQLISGGEDADEIAREAEIEESGGRWQIIERDDLIVTAEAATERIAGILSQSNRAPQVVDYEVDTPGLDVGQLQFIERTDHGLSDYFLIDSVEMRDAGAGKVWRTKVKAVAGAHQEGAVEFFRALADRGTQRSAAVLTTVRWAVNYDPPGGSNALVVFDPMPGTREVSRAGYIAVARFIWPTATKPSVNTVQVDILMNGVTIFPLDEDGNQTYLEYPITASGTVYKYLFAVQSVPPKAIFRARLLTADPTARNGNIELEIRH